MNQIKKSCGKSIIIASLAVTLSGCPSMVTMLPSMMPSLVPSVNLTNVNVNTNKISCYPGSMFSSDYCSIPLSNFIGITSRYADPYDENLLLRFQFNNNQFFFDAINHTNILDKLSANFIVNYPTASKFAALPDKVQRLYIKIKEDYIPNHRYLELRDSFIIIYTISTLHFATTNCESIPQFSSTESSTQYQQQIMVSKAFAMQFTNAILHNINDEVETKYSDETALYNGVYSTILKLNPNQIQNMAQNIYARTIAFIPEFNQSFYHDGISFGDLGTFSCNKRGNTWYRYGYPFFGENISGIDMRVQFKQVDVLDKFNDDSIPLITDGK